LAKISAAVAWRLAERLRGGNDAKQAQTGTATFVRMDDDGTAWVRLPGNDFDTPVDGSVLADAQEGDTVPYAIGGGQVSVTGNASSPAVGMRAVASAIAPVQAAVRRAAADVAAASGIAAAAQRVASAVNQHFWTDTGGAHVTEVTQEEFTAQASGRNILLNSYGILLRDAETWLASFTDGAVAFFDGAGNAAENITARFGTDGSQIGKDDESHVEITPDSFRMHDSGGGTYFASVLRESGTVNSYEFTWTGDGTAQGFEIDDAAQRPTSPNDLYPSIVVTVDGVVRYDAYPQTMTVVDTGTTTVQGVYFGGDAPADGSTVVMRVTTGLSSAVVAGSTHYQDELGDLTLTEGLDCLAAGFAAHAEGRGNTASGEGSHAEGYGTVTAVDALAAHAEGRFTRAYGDSAHAEGVSTEATGAHSHAQNLGTIALSANQTVIGRNNVADANGEYSLIIGNGLFSGATHRSNALTVDWDGNVEAAGNIRSDSPTIEDNTTYSANTGGNGLQLYNADGSFLGQVRAYARSGADRIRGLQIGGKNEASTAYNYLYLMVDKDGNRLVQVSEVQPWLEMLGLDASTETTMSINSTNVGTINSNKIHKWGQVVTVQFAGLTLSDALANATTSPTLATVPSGYRPKNNVYFAAITTGANIGSSYFAISTAGALTLRNQSGASFPTTRTFAGSFTYIIA